MSMLFKDENCKGGYMIGWLWRVLIGRFRECDHHWIILHREEIRGVDDFGDENGHCWHEYHLRCEKCGEMKFEDTQ